MKRTIGAMLTAAAVVGCQSTGGNWQGSTTHSHPHSIQSSSAMAAKGKASVSDAGVEQVGYNRGWGAMQNRAYHERVAAAVPSHGGMMPGGGHMMPPVGPGGMLGGHMHGGMMGHGGPDMHMHHMGNAGLGPRFSIGRSQIRFVRPTGMKVAWQDGSGTFTPPQLEAPARYNFMQGQIYRLKITDIQNKQGLELYPTLEVYPGNAKVEAFLSHNAVPIELTDEDFDMVQAGNYVTKVIYLPDAKFQEMAIAGVETLVSTRLDPGVDPVHEAHRRGSILAVVRMGGVDLEMPHSPGLQNRPPHVMMMPNPPTLSITQGPTTAPTTQPVSAVGNANATGK